jgi:hypothetical protein
MSVTAAASAKSSFIEAASASIFVFPVAAMVTASATFPWPKAACAFAQIASASLNAEFASSRSTPRRVLFRLAKN